MDIMDRHVIEAMGKTRVIIEDGKITYVGSPQVEYCPLFFRHRGIEKITPEVVKANIEFRIKDFGMCAPGRKLRMRDFLSFGVSELLGMTVFEGILECAVIAGDGAGTMVLDDPEMIQGIGGRISGMVETSPIAGVIEAIGAERVLDPKTAKIDQVDGVAKAVDMGYRSIGVTIAFPQDAALIREEYGNKVAIFAVHTSGIELTDAEELFDVCDIITACASRSVRERARERSLLQVGNRVPIYAASPLGVAILKERMEQINFQKSAEEEDPPRPLI